MPIVARVSRSQPNEELETFELIPGEFNEIKDIIEVTPDPGTNKHYSVTVQSGDFTGISGISVPSWVNVVILPGAQFDDGAFMGSTENVVNLDDLAGDQFDFPDDVVIEGDLTVNNNTSSNTSTFEKNLEVKQDLTVGDTLTTSNLVETSSIELKKDINTLDENNLDKICRLNPVKFKWKDSGEDDIGLIAEHLETVYPGLVERSENGDVRGIRYSKLTTVLIGAVKDLKEEVDDLKSEIKELKRKVD